MRQSKQANEAMASIKQEFTISRSQYDSAALNLNAYELMLSRGCCSPQTNGDSIDEALDQLNNLDAEFITAKLPCGRIDLTKRLEGRGFNYVETNLKPHLILNKKKGINCQETDRSIVIRPATLISEVNQIKEIAKTAFTNQRFFLDRRVDYQQAQARYARWAENAFYAEDQDLLAVLRGKEVVGFFLNQSAGKKVHWVLNAIKVDFQGEGIGKNAWKRMIAIHKDSGYSEIESSISAHNIRVLSLYASLGFRFKEPEVRMHWFKPR